MDNKTTKLIWGEKQLQEVSSKTLDPLATEVAEIIVIYNEELSEEDKKNVRDFLENWKIENDKYSENFIKIKDIIDTWSETIKDYCLIKLRTQDELFEDLTEEEK
jgi:hypothetical protein